MTDALEDARVRAMGDQRRELHAAVLQFVLGEMIRVGGVGKVRALLLAIAADLEEFDRGASPGSGS